MWGWKNRDECCLTQLRLQIFTNLENQDGRQFFFLGGENFNRSFSCWKKQKQRQPWESDLGAIRVDHNKPVPYYSERFSKSSTRRFKGYRKEHPLKCSYHYLTIRWTIELLNQTSRCSIRCKNYNFLSHLSNYVTRQLIQNHALCFKT